ncbi:MAG: beta-lactamase family protein [Flavobacteriaceae bacterium]|jgi:CubicO group peptidase (beta-lactamase class C family)|nr:beta-lactamase family protein [Flavobacteriaceae bacterium]
MNNKIKLSLLVFLSLVACKNKDNNDELAMNIPIIKEHNVLTNNTFNVPFKELSPEFILEKSALIEDFYNKNINKDNYTGSFLVAKNGQILYENYSGFANRKNNEPVDENTPLHVASVGKVVTAVTVLKLVDQGKVNLDQPVGEIIEGFPYSNITVRLLLNHRSGLKYYGYYDKTWDFRKTVTNNDVIEVINSKKIPLEFTPNTRFKYSNTNYVLLASIVEKVTNKSFKEAVKELIFDPLQMTHSFVFDDINKKDLVSQSYKGNNTLMRWDYMDGTYGDKNIYTTPRDFLKLDMALYSDDFLSAAMKNEMYQGYSFESKGDRNYGLGIRMIKMKNGSQYTYHNGWWRGSTSSYIRLAQDSVSIILFSNKYSTLTYKTVDLSHHFGDYSVGNLEL